MWILLTFQPFVAFGRAQKNIVHVHVPLPACTTFGIYFSKLYGSNSGTSRAA